MRKILSTTLTVMIFSSVFYAKTNIISNEAIDDKKMKYIQKICLDGYVYINVYQKKPVMTVQFGSSTALTEYPVLQGFTQSFVEGFAGSKPEQCQNK